MTAVGGLVDGVPGDPELLGHLRRREALAVEQVEHLAVAVGQVGDQRGQVLLALPLLEPVRASRIPTVGERRASFAAHS